MKHIEPPKIGSKISSLLESPKIIKDGRVWLGTWESTQSGYKLIGSEWQEIRI